MKRTHFDQANLLVQLISEHYSGRILNEMLLYSLVEATEICFSLCNASCYSLCMRYSTESGCYCFAHTSQLGLDDNLKQSLFVGLYEDLHLMPPCLPTSHRFRNQL